ncbi:MAG: DUF4097 family beta strand repeat-containing protein [Oscillospiraceae bacterium]
MQNYSNVKLAFSGKQTIEETNFIDIVATVGRIELIPYEKKEVLYEVYLENPVALAKFNVSIDKLRNKIEIVLKHRNIIFSPFLNKALIKIYIPKIYKNGIVINAVSASVFGEGISVRHIDASCVSGSISLVDCSTETTFLSCVSGGIYVANSKANIFMAKNKSGSIKVKNIAFANQNVSETSIIAETISGKLELGLLDCYSKIDAKTTSGKITADFPKNYVYQQEFSTVSGKIKNNYDTTKHIGKVCSNAINRVKMSVISGDINLNQ